MEAATTDYDYLVVGAGFFGAVIAERIANELNKSVLVIDQRDHIGGNCYSTQDPDTGIEYHLYGTHIFHTSNKEVWAYINRFTDFNDYKHTVFAIHKGKAYQMPINVDTINQFYGVNLTQRDARAFLEKEIKKSFVIQPKNLEEKAINMMGRPLYEAFIKGYTQKQWGKDPRKLPESIINRIPIRFNKDNTYFHNAKWQGLPVEGYTRIFEKMLDHPKIKVQLNTNYFEHRKDLIPKEKIIYTGPLDKFFDYKLGALEWRSVYFKKEVQLREHYQENSVLNYPDLDRKHTRTHEPKHLHPEKEYPKNKTLVLFEFPTIDQNEPYYPVNDEKNAKLHKRYMSIASGVENLVIGGRLGGYKYYDMDQTIAMALKTFEKLSNGAS